ncbi:MAG: hypothetical protein RBS80_17675 [Thermoguttaceae bacterium]|jgi:hypothetical protein|nr:hypothetical protein [Thermoguttaceae bacterium]
MILLAQTDRLTLFLLVAIGLTIAIMMMRAHRYLSRQRGDDSALVVPRSRPDPVTRLMDGPSELARWEVEMHQTARSLSAELDSRISVLRAMVAEGDRVASRLENALREASKVEPNHGESIEHVPTGGQPLAHSDLSSEEVYTLADYGFPHADIAARLGRPLAEIERILSARK